MTGGHRWWKEPLLHFLILAVGLFAVQRFLSPQPDAGQPDEIVVSQQRINSLILTFHRTWQRPPTPDELDGLIDDYIKEEVFYREALKMGLDRDDTLIRRRMRQKLEFLAEDFADAVQPTDEQLQEYLDSHPASFRIESVTSFHQVFLNPRERGETLAADVEAMLDRLQSGGEDVDPTQLGDPILLPFENPPMRAQQIANQFGQEFAQQLGDIPLGVWDGPIRSAYGAHLILVNDRTPGRAPQLDEVRAAVQRDWFADRRAESKQQFFDSLIEKYLVRIEEEPQAPSGGEAFE